MPSWHEEYLAALVERDKAEKSQEAVFKLYTKLADRTATLEDASALPPDRPLPVDSPSPSPKPQDTKAKKDSKVEPGAQSPVQGDTLASVRKDLGEAQRSRGVMEARLNSVSEELQKLKLQSSLDKTQIRELIKEKTLLITGLRDRDEELKGKAKLLEDGYDETVSLTLQLNMAEERKTKLEQENKDLVDRWMKKMAQEADAMNDKSKFS